MSVEKMSVYLCGPISGESYDSVMDWRDEITDKLHPEIRIFSPLRHKHYLKGEEDISKTYDQHILSTARSITVRDRFDVFHSDIMIANLLGANIVSIGSMIEYGWADAKGIPVITIMEKEGNLHDHPMVKEISGWIVHSVEEAAYVANAVLVTGVDAKTIVK